jgi:predicted metal-dependent hydrolase
MYLNVLSHESRLFDRRLSGLLASKTSLGQGTAACRSLMSRQQLGFEFARPDIPSMASVELAATRARSMPRMHQDGSESVVQADPPELPAAHSPDALDTDPDLDVSEVADAMDVSDSELARALELSLRARYGDRGLALRLCVTDNVRTMVSLKKDQARGQIEARIHHMFLQATPELWNALGEYLFSGDRDAARSIARYIEQHRQHIRRPERRTPTLPAAGKHHDLQEIYQAVNQRYFDGTVSVHVTWARSQAAHERATRRSIKLGSYTSRDQLIRVHPALDAAFVPRYFVEYIVYHEMLHHVLPPSRGTGKGRRELHGPAFVARERQFDGYQAALDWERKNLGKLLKRRKRRGANIER